MADSSDTLWVLRDGLTLPTTTVLLALRLENAGVKLQREGEYLRVFRLGATGLPESAGLSEETAQEVRQHKHHLLLLVDYCQKDHKSAQQKSATRSKRNTSATSAAQP